MVLSLLYCILLITLLCCIFGIAENYAVFWVKSVSLKSGWCKERDILQVCTQAFTLSLPHIQDC